ncbi:uncharacterized protein LOC128257800 [Drosophila gunungcola]|uniref:uncharacterized protein LOC128257800 n=1 Tax=Drosophila gunungcola TaxID=103775 RepID=UPI0022E7485B|nr:uncharacterized protein LOC128257800 [Drosophila gunungcola]
MISTALAKMEAHMTNIECTNYIPDIIMNVSCILNRTAHKTGSLNMEFAVSQDVIDVNGIYILTIKQGSYLTNFTAIKLELCQLLDSVESHFLLKMVTTEIRRIGNLPLECPFKMNKRYYVKEFTINSNVIPSYIPAVNFISDFHIFIKNRKAGRIIIRGRLIHRR